MIKGRQDKQGNQNRQTSNVLVVGIGSPHGDDQIGWIVAQTLATRMPGRVDIKIARQPAELLDWLHDVRHLVVCDACQIGDPPGTLHCWNWTSDSLSLGVRSAAHDLTLPFVLSLAQRLGRLPEKVTVWGIEVSDISTNHSLSDSLRNALPQIVQAIGGELLLELTIPQGCHYA